MVNKAKKQGTTYESNIVKRLNENSNMKAQRFAEGGSNDLGDIQLFVDGEEYFICLLYTSPSPRDRTRSRMPSSA